MERRAFYAQNTSDGCDLRGFFMAMAGPAAATVITSPSDPALTGATYDNFDTASTISAGTGGSISRPGFTLNNLGSIRSMELTMGYNGSFSVSGGSVLISTNMDFVFDNPVTAFLFDISAFSFGEIWNFHVYDSGGGLLHTFIGTNPSQNAVDKFGWSGSDIRRVHMVTTQGTSDGILLDNLYFTSNATSGPPVPAPAALALLLAGLATMPARRRG